MKRATEQEVNEDIIVDKPGLVHQSSIAYLYLSIDKKVKFIFPRDTFKRPTKVKIQVKKLSISTFDN